MRELKAKRKLKSIQNRRSCFKYIHSVFKKSYINSVGDPQERLEIACKQVDDTLRTMANAEPNKTSFFVLVMNDFKEYLDKLSGHEELMKKAFEPVEAELVTL